MPDSKFEVCAALSKSIDALPGVMQIWSGPGCGPALDGEFCAAAFTIDPSSGWKSLGRIVDAVYQGDLNARVSVGRTEGGEIAFGITFPDDASLLPVITRLVGADESASVVKSLTEVR